MMEKRKKFNGLLFHHIDYKDITSMKAFDAIVENCF